MHSICHLSQLADEACTERQGTFFQRFTPASRCRRWLLPVAPVPLGTRHRPCSFRPPHSHVTHHARSELRLPPSRSSFVHFCGRNTFPPLLDYSGGLPRSLPRSFRKSSLNLSRSHRHHQLDRSQARLDRRVNASGCELASSVHAPPL